jgi:hypothetical protein
LREELTNGSPDEKNKVNLMLAEARVGRIEAAKKLIDELGASESKNGELHLERARALAQLSLHVEEGQKAEYVEGALTALERAAEEGYRDPFRVNAEADLTPVREQERFKAVVARLQPAL